MRIKKFLNSLMILSTLPMINLSVIGMSSCAKCQNHEKGEMLSICIDKQPLSHSAIYKCKKCDEEYIDSFKPSEISTPILDINGDLTGISKDNKVKVSCFYHDISENTDLDLDCTLKWQGSGATFLDKKNYNIQFFQKNSDYQKKYKKVMHEGWTEESKYTLKANWADGLVSRNIVASRLYGDIIRSDKILDEPNQLLNGGAIDGYPILLYINNEYVGLYTFQIAKDKQMFQTPDGSVKPECILFAQNINDSTIFKEPIAEDLSNGWKVEYFNEKQTQKKYIDSMNNLINFVLNSTDQEFLDNINQYLDVDRTIDYLVHSEILCSTDNIIHNIVWVTYDGIKWMPSAYDLDGSLGIFPNGDAVQYDYDINISNHHLFNRVLNLYSNKFVSKVKDSLNNCLSINSINNRLFEFVSTINAFVYDSNIKKWPLPFPESGKLINCSNFIKNRHNYLLEKYK